MRTTEQNMAEEATGIRQRGDRFGKIFADGGEEMDVADAARRFQRGKRVEIPNAGAGSYKTVFEALGATEVKVYEWSSSAGDWSFGIKVNGGWCPAWQDNRWPHCGFGYAMDNRLSFETFADLCEWNSAQG